MTAPAPTTRTQLLLAILRNKNLAPGTTEYDLEQRILEKLSTDDLTIYLRKQNERIDAERAQDQRIQQQAERAADNTLFRLKQQREAHEQEQARLAKNRPSDWTAFEQGAKDYGLWAVSEANFGVLLARVGSPFNAYQAKLQVEAGQALVFPPSEQDLAAWAQEKQEVHTRYLVNLAEHDPDKLRKTARFESEQRRAEAIRTEDRRQIEHRKKLDRQLGFPILPETNSDGVPLNSKFFVRATAETLKKYIRMFGASQITDAIRHRI